MRGVHKKRIQIGIFLLVIIGVVYIFWNRTTTESFFDKKEACDAVAADNTALNAIPGLNKYSKLISSIKGSEGILNELKGMKTEACSISATGYSCTTLTAQVTTLEAQLNSANTYKNNSFFSSTVTPVLDGITALIKQCTNAKDGIKSASTDTYNSQLNTSSLTFIMNSPLDLPNCVSWFDASMFNSQASGTVIKRWAPASSSFGSTRFSMIGSAIVRPGQLNNKAVLEFNDSNGMTLCIPQTNSDGTQSCSTTTINEPGAYTLFLVSRLLGRKNGRLFNGGTNTTFGYWGAYKNIFKTDQGILTDLNTRVDTNWDVFRIKRGTNNNGSMYNNRNLIKSYTTTSGIKEFNINQTGSSEKSDGHVAEVIIYNRELSDRECEAVELYLYRKWFP